MTAIAITREAPCGDFTREEFSEALRRVLPGSQPSEALSVSLVALLDDGSLATVVAVGSDPQGDSGRLLWTDHDWAELVEAGAVNPRPSCGGDRTLIPVMLGPILYGAIDWRGPCPQGALRCEVVERASEEFLASLIRRIHG